MHNRMLKKLDVDLAGIDADNKAARKKRKLVKREAKELHDQRENTEDAYIKLKESCK